jgi:hypothetical protein
MRQRIEDLGRILAMLDKLYSDANLFHIYLRCFRPKDYPEWWAKLTPEEQLGKVGEFVYGIEDMQERLAEIIEVAEGEDRLNRGYDE